MRIGPDAARYLLAGRGVRVAKPFHLRWLFPYLCEDDVRKWRVLWLCSWPLLAGLMFTYSWLHDVGVYRSLAAAVVLLALPGVLGPSVVRPVGVDLPAMVLGLGAVVAAQVDWLPLAVVLICLAGLGKESMPVWAALWLWNPVLLVGLIPVGLRAWRVKPQIDEVTARADLRFVHDHPIRSALKAHAGQWRDGWVMVAPWGIGVLSLVDFSLPVVVCIVVAYMQLSVATDTVRLLHTAAGVPVALAAVQVIPEQWLLLAVVGHVVWWRRPVLI